MRGNVFRMKMSSGSKGSSKIRLTVMMISVVKAALPYDVPSYYYYIQSLTPFPFVHQEKYDFYSVINLKRSRRERIHEAITNRNNDNNLFS